MRQRRVRFYGVIVGLLVVVAVVRCGTAADLPVLSTATPPIPPLLEVTPTPLAFMLPGRPNLRATLALTPTPGPPRLELARVLESGSAFNLVSLSPDGAYLFAGLDQTYTLYRADSFETIWEITLAAEVVEVGWALTRGELHLQFEGRIDTYGLRSGRFKRSLADPQIGFQPGAFSPDGRWVVTPHSSALAVFNLVEDAAAQDTDLRAGRISEIAWQPDSRRFVVVTADADLFICAAGNPPDCVPSPWAAYAWDVVVVSAGPDGRRALVAYRPFEALLRVELVTTWDLVEGELLAVLSDAINSSGTAAWMPDGEAISLASAGTRAVYDADTGEELVRLRQGAGAVWLTADRARVITQFGSPQPGEQIGQKIVSLYAWGMQDWLAAGVGESDLRIVSATSYTISAWDTQQGREAHVLAGGFASRPTQAVFSPDGSAVAVRVDARWLVWQFEGDASPLPLADSRRAQDVHWLPDSRRVAAAVDGQVVLWEIGQDQPVSRLDGGDSLIRAIDISRDGRWLASGSADGAILIWDVETGERLHTYRAAEQIYRLRWSPDGTRLAALLKDGDDAHLLIWQPANGQYVATRTGLHRFVSVEWRSDEEMAIIAYPTLWLWNLRTGHSRRVDLDNPLPAPGLLALLDQNRLLAYSPSQQTIGWWDVTSGYFLYRLAVPVNPPGKQDGAIVLGADGHWMAISRAGEVEIWHITR